MVAWPELRPSLRRWVLGRPEKPVDPTAGPVQRLAWQLRRLREHAGNPSYRLLARRAHYSASTLADAAKGGRLPSLEVTLGYVQACGGDPAEWRARWKTMLVGPTPSSATRRVIRWPRPSASTASCHARWSGATPGRARWPSSGP
ncbi:helix-turn-helix transcriptional regulator [Micromonospora sp. NPDC048986]|uniref:helix-turn-helix domain-containing protein n=1 Tax=Micromonospora sp. NPDC048986 TaxID=3155644 RepID=UPI0033D8B465